MQFCRGSVPVEPVQNPLIWFNKVPTIKGLSVKYLKLLDLAVLANYGS